MRQRNTILSYLTVGSRDRPTAVPEFTGLVFAKISLKRSFLSKTEKERFGLVSRKLGLEVRGGWPHSRPQ
jgi:hypothetical protein